jgi:YidC/Oxa1 family membrane protein insertase
MEKIATVMPGRNYGLAIIIVVLLVRVLLYPISRKSTMSMLRMKELQPKIAELQAKYAGNREELGRRQMELYQKEGVNPLGGCLPMMLQMPVWIGLWGALSAAVNLRHQPFLFWIKDLAGDDALIRFAGRLSIPLGCFDLPLPNVVNVLPLLMVVVMFLQQRNMTPAQTDPNQPNPKIMMYMMTGMFLFMLYSAPAGLNLYIMTSTVAGLLEQWWVRRHYEDLKARGLLAPADAKPGWFGRLIARIRAIQEEQERLRSGKGDKGGERDRGDRDRGDRKKKR